MQRKTEPLSEQNRDLREAHMKSLNEMEELKRFQGSRFDEFSRKRLIENQDTFHELTTRIQELQNEVNCLNDSRDFKDAESVRSGLSHVQSQPAFFTLFRDLGGMLSRSVGMPSRNDKPRDIWDTHGISGNVFVNPTASSSSTYPGGFYPWISNVTEHISPHVTSECQDPDTALDPRCQPEIHSTPVREDFQRIVEQTNKDCRFRILILTNSPRQQRSLVGRFDSRLRYILVHNFPRKQWIKVVEMVESVDEQKSSRTIRGTHGPNFEVLDAKIASALNRIIQNTRFKKKRQSGGNESSKKKTASSEQDRSLT